MIWINGVLSDTLPANDRGLLYGDGVWETLALRQGIPQRLNWHLERLQQGLQALAITAPNNTSLLNEIQMAAALQPDAVLKLVVTRGVGMRGYNPHGSQQPTRILQLLPHPEYPSEYSTDGIRLALCQTRLAQQPLLAGFKHLNRLEQVLARAEFGATFQEGLVLDYAGNVIEGTMSNLFLVRTDGEVVTPDLSQCGIAGIMRRTVLTQLQAWGIPYRICPLKLPEVEAAGSLFMTNSLIGIWPVREFLGKAYHPSTLVHRLQQNINATL